MHPTLDPLSDEWKSNSSFTRRYVAHDSLCEIQNSTSEFRLRKDYMMDGIQEREVIGSDRIKGKRDSKSKILGIRVIS